MRSALMDHSPTTPEFTVNGAGINRDRFVHDIDTAMWLTGQRVVSGYATGDCRTLNSYAEHGDIERCHHHRHVR